MARLRDERGIEFLFESLDDEDEVLDVPEESGGGDVRWKDSGHKWLGLRVRRFFDGVSQDGVIRKWLPPRDGDDPLWHMEHYDGDSEDLDESEVIKALDAYKRNLKSEDGGGGRSDSPASGSGANGDAAVEVCEPCESPQTAQSRKKTGGR